MPKTWREMGREVYLHLAPKRLIQVIELAKFGVVLMKVGPTCRPDAESKVIDMFNSPCRYLRIGGSGLSELVYSGGFKRRRFGHLRMVEASELLSDIQGKRSAWLLVVRGRIQHSAGLVHMPRQGGDITQASVSPIFKMESALACTYEEAANQPDIQPDT